MTQYEVEYMTIYVEEAESAEETRKIVEENCSDEYQYFRVRKVRP